MPYEPGLKNDELFSCDGVGYRRVAYSHWGRDIITQRPPVICVHGIVRNRHDFDPLARVLRHYTHVFCPDMPGHGDSAYLDDGRRYHFGSYENDLNMLIARTGSKEIDFIGSSMGGLLGIALAALPGSPIKRLVLNDVGPFVSAEFARNVQAYVENPPVFDNLEQVAGHLKEVHKGFAPMEADDWAQMAQSGVRKREDGKWALTFDPKLAQGLLDVTKDVDLRAAFQKIEAEILVLRGARSYILLPELADEMRQLNPRTQIVTIQKAGHTPMLNDEAQISCVQSFLKLEQPALSRNVSANLGADEKTFFQDLFKTPSQT